MPDHKILLTELDSVVFGDGLGSINAKRVSNTLAGHPTESKTVCRQKRLKNSPFCCTLAEYFILDEKFTTALSIFVFSKVAEMGL